MASKKDSKSKSKKKETKRTKKKSKSKKSKKTKISSPDARMIWLYGAHESIVLQTIRRLMDYGSEDSLKLREQLGISMDEFILTVAPYPAQHRAKVIKELRELDKAVIVIAGVDTDRKNKALKKLYEGSEAAYIHPHERQFHIDMMRESNSISFPEAEKRQEKWLEYLQDEFKKSNLQVIRN